MHLFFTARQRRDSHFIILRLTTIALCNLMTLIAHGNESYVLSSGQSIDVKISKSMPVAVSNGKIIKVKDNGHLLRVTGKKAGSALITVGGQKINITVLSEMRFALFENLRQAVEGKRGLSVEAEGTTGTGIIEITGRLLRFQDWLDIAKAAQSSPQEFTFLAQIAPEVLSEAKLYFAQLIRTTGLPDLPIELVPSAAVTLPVEPADLKARVSKVLHPFGFKIERSASSLGLEPLVRVKIVVAELRKKMMSRLGVTWPDRVEASLLPALLAPVGGLAVSLNTLEENGLGKVLASPVLVCRSGKEANFLAGGEVSSKKLFEIS